MRQPGEPSVEEILESIKQVMARDAAAVTAGPVATGASHGILDLKAEDALADGVLADGVLADGVLVDGALTDPPVAETPLLGDGAAASARGALDALSSVAAAAPTGQVGGSSLEAMVREMLRPALSAWLDTHLPPLVERMVAAEIARIVAHRA